MGMGETRKVVEALKAKYSPPAYAMFTEVGDGTGGNCRRHADAVAMSIWPSRGLLLEGFEVKSSRSDWKKELENPAKADSIFKFCDRWWVVAWESDIVRRGELPPTWGLMVLDGRGLKVSVDAPRLEPKPITRSFLAAIFRRAVEQSVDDKVLKDQWNLGYAEGKKYFEECNEQDRKNHNELYARVKKFEEASGVSIRYGWEKPEKIGEAVRYVLHGEMPVGKLKQVMSWVDQVRESGNKLLKELEGKE